MKKGNIIQRIKSYLTEVKGELKKVTWPSKSDLHKTTIAVIILSIIFGVYLTLVDLAFRELVDRIIAIFR
jgi:preprotein translocase subunit SecE